MFRNIIALCFIAGTTTAQPVFINRAADLGLTHQYTGGWEHFVGGGVAVFDCDDDLLPEVFFAGGEAPATLLRNTSTRFGQITFTSEIIPITGVTGAYPLDINSDGYMDLFVMRVGPNHVLKGGPDCTFTDMGFPSENHWTTAFSATWEAGNTAPTLAIGNYVNRDDPEGPFEACDTSFLLRPDGETYTSTALTPGYCPLSMLFSDWGRNGRQDLRISNDRHYYVRKGNEQMWALEATPRLYKEVDGWTDFSIWGMGIASRDISGDGRPEIFLTSMGDQKMRMPDTAKNGPAFLDATYGRGTTAHRPYTGGDGRPSTGWHVEFGDVNNDGLDDVFIAKGNVEQMPDSAMADPNNLLMQNPDHTFTERGLEAGIAAMDRSRGGALVDLNLDGRLDLIVTNRRAAVEVYENTTQNSGNWLLLDVRQSGANPQAVGAWVEINDGDNTWAREITVGGGHAGGSATLMHFGLGGTTAVMLRVIWPNGDTSDWMEVKANRLWQLTPQGISLIDG